MNPIGNKKFSVDEGHLRRRQARKAYIFQLQKWLVRGGSEKEDYKD